MSLPKSVKVGYRTYQVTPSPQQATSIQREYNGLHCLERGVIEIEPSLDDVHKAQVFLHELLHACWAVGCVPDEDEERAVSILARMLTQVFQDNPDVISWISKNVKAS